MTLMGRMKFSAPSKRVKESAPAPLVSFLMMLN